MKTKFNLKDYMYVLIMINENTLFYIILESVTRGKLNRIHYLYSSIKKANK